MNAFHKRYIEEVRSSRPSTVSSDDVGQAPAKYMNVEDFKPLIDDPNVIFDELPPPNERVVFSSQWNEGSLVWRSLPMDSDLKKHIIATESDWKHNGNFTKEAKPEAYVIGYIPRPGGPITRPHGDVITTTRRPMKIVKVKGTPKKEKQTKGVGMEEARRESKSSSTDEQTHDAPAQAGTLQDNIIR